MPCHTRVLVQVEKTKWTEKARAKLGLPKTGGLDAYNAERVRIEAGKLKLRAAVKAKYPLAGIKEEGNKITLKLDI